MLKMNLRTTVILLFNFQNWASAVLTEARGAHRVNTVDLQQDELLLHIDVRRPKLRRQQRRNDVHLCDIVNPSPELCCRDILRSCR